MQIDIMLESGQQSKKEKAPIGRVYSSTISSTSHNKFTTLILKFYKTSSIIVTNLISNLDPPKTKTKTKKCTSRQISSILSEKITYHSEVQRILEMLRRSSPVWNHSYLSRWTQNLWPGSPSWFETVFSSTARTLRNLQGRQPHQQNTGAHCLSPQASD